jgi:FAD:protein FMN transferase
LLASAALQELSHSEPCMGTLFTVRAYARDAAAGYRAIGAAFRALHAIDEVLSDYRPGNALDQFCAQGHEGFVPVHPHLCRVLEASLRLAAETDGAFDPTLGPLTRLWRAARKQKQLPTQDAVAAARKRTGWQGIELDAEAGRARLPKPDMQLDFGGIAKGYAADRALDLLREAGFPQALVVAGGDVAAGEAPPAEAGWRVSLHAGGNATEGNAERRLLSLRQGAVSTSGDVFQFVEIDGVRYSHILDPASGHGLTEALAASVVAPTAMESDSIATALCVMGLDAARRWLAGRDSIAARLEYREGDAVRDWSSTGMPYVEEPESSAHAAEASA